MTDIHKRILPGICFTVILILFSGCVSSEKDTLKQVQTEKQADTFKYTDTCLSELCICHTVNADGSIILWGDREEDGKFFAYAVQNTKDLQAGDEVALLYDEKARKEAPHRNQNTCTIYILQTGTYELSDITPNIIRQAVDGARKNKWTRTMVKAEEEQDASAADDTVTQEGSSDDDQSVLASQTDEMLITQESEQTKTQEENPVEADTPVMTDVFDINLKNLGYEEPISVSLSTQNGYYAELNGKTFKLDEKYTYCWSDTVYELSELTYLGTTMTTPQKHHILLFINENVQLEAGRIEAIAPTPDGGYMIGFIPVPLQVLIR